MTVLALPRILQDYPHLGEWLTIRPDGTVLAHSGKVELGQGIRTALAQLVAHELRIPVDRVVMAAASTDSSPDEGVTSGSRSIEESNEGLRQVAADLRSALIRRAASRMGVAAGELLVRDGAVLGPGGQVIPYPELVDDELARERVTGEGELTPARAGSLLGESVPRVGLESMLLGRPAFIQDLAPPGMLHARVCRPPGPGARLVEVDDRDVRAMPGVRAVVRDGSFLAVVADREEQAIRAARRLRRATDWSAAEVFPESPRFMLDEPTVDVVVADVGAPLPAGTVARVVQAAYSRPYLAHAALGPSCALATFAAGRYDVLSHSQGIHHLRQELAKVLGVERAAVTVTHVEGAGCYGANGADDAALDAALVARSLPGTPIRVQWMRDDEAAWEPFGTAMFIELRAGLDADGGIVDWSHEVWGNGHRDRAGSDSPATVTNLLAASHLAEPFEPSVAPAPPSRSSGSGRNAAPIYDFKRQRVVNHYVPRTPIRVSALRSLGAHANVFAIESFMDEIAVQLGADPLEHRLRYLDDPRARRVLAVVAANASWADRPRSGDGRGLGLGFARYKNAGAYVAVIAEVALGDELELRRVWAAVDAGLAVNPDGLRNQVEGGIIQAASWTLKEQVTFTRSHVTSRDWRTYPVIRFDETPTLDVVIVQRYDEHPVGVGEAVAGPTAAAIGNAVFAASGIRLRDMPFTRERFMAGAW